ncbi:MAG: hypothetical protein ABH874_07795 [Methanobacteriota archaeon]
MNRNFVLFAIGIFLISIAMLCFQVALTYEFSFMFWVQVSITVISIAMFGLGVGSVIGYFAAKKKPEKYFSTLYYSSIAFGISILLSLFLISHGSKISFSGLIPFLLYFSLASALPFVFSGIVLSVGLNYPSAEKKVISFIYFSDLVGAGIGSFLITFLLPFSSVEGAIIFCAVLAIAAAPFFLGGIDKKNGLALLSIVLIFLLLFSTFNSSFVPEPSNEKYLYKLKASGAKVLDTKWTAVSRVDVVQEKENLIKFIVNGAYPVTASYGRVSSYGLENDPRYIMFLMQPKNMVAIGSGGGVEVRMALHAGVEKVTAVEINPFIIEYMKNDLAEFSSRIYYDPKVATIIEDGRTYVHRSTEKYDLIENGVIGSVALVVPTQAVLTFQDAYVYTVEANKDWWRHLSSKGIALVLLYARMDDPYNVIDKEKGITYTLLRQYFTVKQALAEEGVEPEKHLVIFRFAEPSSQTEYTFIFKEEVTPSLVEELIKAAKKIEEEKNRAAKSTSYKFEPIFAPYYNTSLNFEEIAKTIPKHRSVSPAVDDKPFFYYTESSPPKELHQMLFLLGFLTFVFIILPIMVERRLKFEYSASLYLLVYFLCLGVGYILIEAVLIQKLTLFLGRPAYAFQVVLFSMLVFSGLGSFLTGVLVPSNKGILRKAYLILAVTSLAIFLWAFILPKLIYGYMYLSILKKVLLSIAFLAPLAVLMGMPFPTGLRITSSLSNRDVIWMYGINGAGSVIGAIIGILIAFNYGYSYSLFAGGIIYSLALMTMLVVGSKIKSAFI